MRIPASSTTPDGLGLSLELFNPSPDQALDGSGWTLEAIGVVLPPGTVVLPQQFLVVAADDQKFRAHYGGGVLMVAGYTQPLKDQSEPLILKNRGRTVVDRVDLSRTRPAP